MNITIQVEGTVLASKRWNEWPTVGTQRINFWTIVDSSDISIKGNGTIDGQGYMWWIR